MKRWTRAAILCALIAAVCHTSPINAAISNGSYMTETSAINVVKHFPDNMSVGISPETPLTIEFGGAVNQSFYQNVSFNLFNGTEPVNGELFYNPAARQIMFKASQPLAQGQTYTAQVSYYDGLGRNAEKVWSFQTANLGESAIDAYSASAASTASAQNSSKAEPKVNSKNLILTNASMGSGTLHHDASLEISFSEPLDVKALKSAPISLYENNRPIGIDYRLSKDMKTITLSPRAELKDSASYAVAIEKTIASTSGHKLAKKTLIPFKIASANEAPINQYELEERPAPAAQARASLSDVSNQLSQTVQQSAQSVQNNAQNSLLNAVGSYQNLQGNLTQGYQNAQANVQQGYQNAQMNVQQGYQNAQANVQQGYQNLQNNVNQSYQGLQNSYQNMQANASQNYDAVKSALQNGLSDPMTAYQTAQSAYQNTKANVQQTYQNAQANLQQNYQNAQANVQQSYQNVQASAQQSYQNAQQALQSGIENPFASQTTAAFAPNQSNYNTNQVQMSARASVQQQAPAEQVQLIGLAPQNGSKVSNLAQPVTIGFSEEIKPETLNEFTFRLEDDFGPVPAKIHYFQGRKQATLTPVGLLDAERNYRIVVTQGITDLYGRPIKNGINSMFATVTPTSAPATPAVPAQTMTAQVSPQREAQELESFDRPEAARASLANTNQYAQQNYSAQMAANQTNYAQPMMNNQQNANVNSYMAGANKNVIASAQADARALNPFKVCSIYPGLNSDNVARKSKIAVHFTEECDPKTINNINISMFGNQTRVDGKVTYDRKNNRAIFEPARPLDTRTEYKVIVSDKIKSKKGESLTERFSWSFTTTSDSKTQYSPIAARTAEADTAFYIPLVDSKVKATPSQTVAAAQASANKSTQTTSFSYVPSKHWAFRSMKHISNKGILNAFPFTFTDNVTRYEFASAINNALNNLKSMQNTNPSKLRVADMIELEQLVIEFRSELKSYGVNPGWFENFLQSQGVNLNQVEAKVQQLNS